MVKNRLLSIGVGVLFAAAAARCVAPVTPTPTPLVIVVTATPAPATETPRPSPTPVAPTDTPPTSPTPGPPTETTLPTPTPAADAVVAVRAANLRRGPGLVYPVVAVLREGDRLTVEARSPNGHWLQVRTEREVKGWVATDLATLNRALGPVAVAVVIPPTPVPPTPPPSPVPGVSPTPPCFRVPIRGFGKVWDENPAARALVGCPYAIELGMGYEAQRFEGGVMFWTDADFYDNRAVVWVLFADDSTYARVPDTWMSGQAEPTPLTPPGGLYEPRGRLGKAWREGAGVRNRLGWAIETVQQGRGAWQGFDRGYMFWLVYRAGAADEERWIYVLGTYYPCPPCGSRNDWLKFVDT